MPREAAFQEEFMEFLIRTLKEHQLYGGKIGIDLLDVTLLELLQKEDLTLVDGQDIMLDARRIKSADEIALLEGAASMVDAAYSAVVSNLRAGIRENELVAIVNDLLYRLGSDQVEAVNVVSGPRCSPHPHYFTDRIIRPDETVFLDIMHSYNGYRTCYYRTFQVGRASQSLRDAYKQCYDWLYASIEQVKPGNTTADIASTWPTAESLGFESEAAAFGLQFGHGIGMSIWEKPVISRRFSLDTPMVLQEGMVFALETYCAAADGSGAARIEEEIVVTADGHKIITRYPCDELICVRA
ncbi:MAG: Xaa-Pro peptidase family protein [Thermoleophilia bacterium]|nr:Xaa-Pro peptidase family protein [Thermoleophilia bacterium]